MRRAELRRLGRGGGRVATDSDGNIKSDGNTDGDDNTDGDGTD